MEQGQVTTTNNGLSYIYTILPTKKELIQRLFLEEKITFDEMWVLIQESPDTRYVPIIQQTHPFVINPELPWTVSTNNQQNGNNS